MQENLDSQPQLVGTVLAVQANFYQVQLQQVAAPQFLLCTRRTRLKKIGQHVMVGDRVRVENPDWQGGRGAIAEVLPRQSQLDRPAIANVNHILLVFAVADPVLEPLQLSRFLVKAESTGLNVTLCLNKIDLIPSSEQESIRTRIQNWGYDPILISAEQHLYIDTLSARLKGKITVLAGASGVGKSSLINTIIPTVNLRVGEVSGKLAKGRHTTRHVELFATLTNGLIADTPGFNQPDIDNPPEELIYCFPEARKFLNQETCRFSNCLHRDEPGCVVRGDWERYQHYLIFLEEAIQRQNHQKQQAKPEASLKVKTKQQGETYHEPRLETKKYRQKSRRTQLQELERHYEDVEEEE